MLIYGHRSRETLLGTRSFYCPRCQAQTPARHIRVDRWFTLFFIPLFKIATLGDLLECQTCYGAYKPANGAGRLQTVALDPPANPAAAGGCWVAGALVGGLLLTGVGLLLGLAFVFAQMQDPGDNVTGFVGALLICPLPITVAGLLTLSAGLVMVWRKRRASVSPS